GGANYPTGDVTYTNYTSNPANVVRGENLDLFVTYATGWAYSTYVWIDLNNDGDFTDSGEMVISGVSAADNPTTLDLSFTPSASIPLGSYRMRIIGGDGIAENPCYSGSYAVALDFVINIVDPITGAPGCATSLSPADLATNVIRLATLSWNSVFGADAYDLYFGTTPTLTSTDCCRPI
ncbi:MAG TPA: GEVED domain-containing protein, partial [Flavobacterium sp.]|nr:GEVED domain-containing protein [Flavobacterium sp.]